MTVSKSKAHTWAPIGMALVFLLLSVVGAFDGLNRSFLDLSLKVQSRQIRPPQDGVLVIIDEPTIQFMATPYNQRWPWSRDVFASLFLTLHQAGAKQIVVDAMFSENSDRAELDDLLGSYAAAIDGLFLAVLPPQNPYPVFWTQEYRQRYAALHLEDRVGHALYPADVDGVVRHYHWDGSLAQRAAGNVTAPAATVLLRWYGGLKELPPEQVLSAKPFLEAGYGPNGLLSQMGARKVDEYDPQALRQAMAQLPEFGKGLLRGKTVFVATNAAATYDVKAVPVSRLEPGVLVHFTAWANARQQAFISEIGQWGRLSFSGVLACFLAWAMTSWGWNRPNVKLLTWLALAGIALLLTSSYFLLPKLFLPPFAPMAALACGFAVLTTRHWVDEIRRKREVQDLFGSYVSPAVVKRLVENPDSLKLGGEKKELTAYFSDLAGFTDMSEKMDPEPLMNLVNLYLSEMSEFIMEEHGYLDKYIGDAIMGVFGAPEPLNNHALAACRAALKSRDHLAELNKRLVIDHGQALYARIGINTGEMTVGNVGSGRKRNYTVVGDPVNLASRLEGANKTFGTTILLGMRTEELARGEIVTRPVELLRVKGKKQPIQTYELLALKSERTSQVSELASSFVHAYTCYQERDFAAALKQFETIIAQFPDDKLSQLYVDRCRHFLQEPPGPEWDGVYAMKDK